MFLRLMADSNLAVKLKFSLLEMVRFGDPQTRFRCCFCLHVRTGTILLGVGQIILHVICISVLILLALRPDMLPSNGISLGKSNNYAVINTEQPVTRSHILSVILHLVPGVSDLQDSIALPPSRQNEKDKDKASIDTAITESSRVEEKNRENESDLSLEDVSHRWQFHVYRQAEAHALNRRRHHFSPYFALCLSTFSLAFCCFLVHGAIARQPTHLLPFFFLQVFDFIISLLTVVGYMSSTSDIRLWLHTKNGPMYINSTSLTFLLLSISCLVLAFKAYCLGMVWDCYKYLMLVNHHGSRPEDWGADRFGFFPTIWGLLGTGRRSSLYRANNLHSTDARGLNASDGTPRPHPATFDQTNDLPNYDDALKTPANMYAPPPYYRPTETSRPKKDEPSVPNEDTAPQS